MSTRQEQLQYWKDRWRRISLGDNRYDEEGWITVNGTHIHMTDEGEVDKGPPALKTMVKSGKSKGSASNKGASKKKTSGQESKAGSGTKVKKATFAKSGAPSASELGFDQSGYSKAEREYLSEHGKKSWDLLGSEKQKIVDKYVKEAGLPMKVETEDSSYVIDHYDYVGGHISYEGTYKGFTVGKEYPVPGRNATATIASIHVYPNGKGRALANGVEHGIHFNYEFGR